jgi:hypothetical protein
MKRMLRLATIFPLCAAAAAIGGCAPTPAGGNGGNNPPPVTDAVPVMQDFAVAPTVLAMDGGDVLFRAIASDDVAVAGVVFTVTLPDATTVDIDAEPQGDNFYTYMYPAEYNPGATEMSYSVVARVTDGSGQSATSSPVAFVVEPATLPPDPPS